MIHPKALQIIKTSEGLRRMSYKCPAGVLTIGYGHTGKDVRIGMQITDAQAEALLLKDLERFVREVRSLVKVSVSDSQFGALVSFAFNVGYGSLANSTLLKHLNAGNYKAAADEFLKWNKAGGKVLPGLVKRREAERALFLSAD